MSVESEQIVFGSYAHPPHPPQHLFALHLVQRRTVILRVGEKTGTVFELSDDGAKTLALAVRNDRICLDLRYDLPALRLAPDAAWCRCPSGSSLGLSRCHRPSTGFVEYIPAECFVMYQPFAVHRP